LTYVKKFNFPRLNFFFIKPLLNRSIKKKIRICQNTFIFFYFLIFLRKLLILTKNFIEVLSHIFRKEFALEFIPKHLLTPCIIVISFPLNLHDHFDFFPRCRYFLVMLFLVGCLGDSSFPVSGPSIFRVICANI
jgi:hypothetical protein